MTRHRFITRQGFILCMTLILLTSMYTRIVLAESPRQITKGQTLPNATLLGTGGQSVQLDDLKGRIKILSLVPQLNTPVCDEQTHRLSEGNGGLDQLVEIVTISTNTYDDQAYFANKANIHDVTYLSDSPSYDFGKKTGLLISTHGILKRTVLVADHHNVIRYIEHVPMSQLPNFERVYQATRKLLKNHRH
ncbi:MAG: redoxin family protein [Nitrospirales bacterium]